MDQERNLLFGILSVQLKRVDPQQLALVSANWAGEPESPLAECLVKSGLLSSADCRFIDDLLDEAIEADGGNPTKTFERFGGDAQVHDSFLGTIARTSTGAILHSTIPNLPLGTVRTPEEATGVRETPGRYSKIGEYARGGMGRVLVVHDEHLGRDIALKELLPIGGSPVNRNTPASQAAPLMTRFLHEARITGQLEHPSIVPVYELGHRADGSLYYTMRLVHGKTLLKAITEAGSIENRLKLLPHFVDLCNAIAYAHSRNVIHRDIKPENVMVGEFGETVVLDWGLAKSRAAGELHGGSGAGTSDAVNEVDEALLAKTSAGQALGTPVYMPPEQALGQLEKIDERSDVYALGAVLYELLSGRPPFLGKTAKEVLKKVVLGVPDDLGSLDPRIPGELIAICRKAIERAPEDRYQSAKELADEVQRFQSGGFVQAHTYQLFDLVCWVVRRYKPVVLTACLALVALVAVGTYSYANIRTARIKEHAQRVESESRLYEVSMNLAQRHIDDGKMDVARQTLAECSPDFRNWEWGRLRYICDATSISFVGHTESVLDAAFSPDGKRLVSLEEGDAAIMWDASNGKELFRVHPGVSDLGKIAYSPNGEEFATGCNDGLVKIWNAGTGALLQSLTGHAGAVQAVAYTPNGEFVVSGAQDGTVRVWNQQTGKTVRVFETPGATVQDVAIDTAGTRVAVACSDGSVPVFDLESGELILHLDAHPVNLHLGVSGAIQVAFRPGHDQLASCGCDDTAKLWDLRTGNLLETFRGHMHKVWSVAFTPNGDHLTTAATDREAITWNPDTGEQVGTVIGLREPAFAVRYSPDGERMVTAAVGANLHIWDMREPFGAIPLSGHTADVNAVAFSADDRIVASGGGHWHSGGDTRVILWDTATHTILRTLEGHQWSVYTVAFHPNGRWVTSSGGDHRVITWDTETGAIVHEFSADVHQNGVRSIAYSPDGSQILTAGWDGDDGIASEAVIWDAESGARLHTLVPQGSVLDSVAWGPKGTYVATACRDGISRVWNAKTGTLVRELKPDVEKNGWAYSVAFDPRGSRVATGHSSGMIYIWDIATGRQVQQLTGHSIRVNNLTYSPDGSRLASCDNVCVNVWNPDSGSLLMTLPRASNQVAFSHDGLTLATAGMDGNVILWPALPWK